MRSSRGQGRRSIATDQREMSAEEIQEALKDMPPCDEAAKA
jgi:hypothetical protein